MYRAISLLMTMAALTLLPACLSRTPAAKMFALPAEGAAVAPEQRGRFALRLPAYLQRTEMRLFEAASGEVKPCAGGLWAAPLQELLTDALDACLPNGTGTVVCASFAPDFGGQFRARGHFAIKRDGGAETAGDFDFTLPPPAGLPHLSPAALARQYADAVRHLATIMAQD